MIYNLPNRSVCESYQQLSLLGSNLTDGTGSVITCLNLPTNTKSTILGTGQVDWDKVYLSYNGCDTFRFTSESTFEIPGSPVPRSGEDDTLGSNFGGLFYSGGIMQILDPGGGTQAGVAETAMIPTSSVRVYAVQNSTDVDTADGLKSFERTFTFLSDPQVRCTQEFCSSLNYRLGIRGCRNFSNLSGVGVVTASLKATSSLGQTFDATFYYNLQCLASDGVSVGSTFVTTSVGSLPFGFKQEQGAVLTASIFGQNSSFNSQAYVELWPGSQSAQTDNIVTSTPNYTASLSASFVVSDNVYFFVDSGTCSEMMINVTGANMPVTFPNSTTSKEVSVPSCFYESFNTVHCFLNWNGSTVNKTLTVSLGTGTNRVTANFCRAQNSCHTSGSTPENLNV